MIRTLLQLTAFLLSLSTYECAHAHGFGERYDLPVPMSLVIACACLVVALTFLVSATWSSNKFLSNLGELVDINHFGLETTFQSTLKNQVAGVFSTGLLLLCFSTATWGSEDALMNFAPTFIWIIWWIGCSFCVVIFGNFWPSIDPWRSTYRLIHFIFKFKYENVLDQHILQRHTPRWRYPSSLGLWLGVIGLLTWCGLEIIYPIASMPRQLSLFIAAYSLWNWMGMWGFGMEVWCKNADVFSIYFRHLASLHSLFKTKKSSCPSEVSNTVTDQIPTQRGYALSQIAFVIAMIATVLFDGLHAGSAWLWFESTLSKWNFFSADINGYRSGVLGLFLIWFLFLLIYLVTCQFTLWTIDLFFHQKSNPSKDTHPHRIDFVSTGHIFLKSLLPIAFAYLIAHNFSSLFIQGQNIIALASDPLGLMWNIFGTASYYPDIALIDAKVTWYVATCSIVMGHIASVFMGHRAALALSHQSIQSISSRFIWVLNLPMTFLMIAFTALSLSIIAEPLTFFAR